MEQFRLKLLNYFFCHFYLYLLPFWFSNCNFFPFNGIFLLCPSPFLFNSSLPSPLPYPPFLSPPNQPTLGISETGPLPPPPILSQISNHVAHFWNRFQTSLVCLNWSIGLQIFCFRKLITFAIFLWATLCSSKNTFKYFV